MASKPTEATKKAEHFNPETEKLRKEWEFRAFLGGVSLSFVVIFACCVYRIAEMANGWANPIMQNETEFIVLDGVMCAVCVLALTVVHLGLFFAQSQLLKRGRPFLKKRVVKAAKTPPVEGEGEGETKDAQVEGIVQEGEVKSA
jgi:hypothetical protein